MKTFKDIKIGDRVFFKPSKKLHRNSCVGSIIEQVPKEQAPKGKVWMLCWDAVGICIPLTRSNFAGFAKKESK